MLNGLKEKSESPSDVPWFLYILECNDGSLYTGITNDITKRVKKHNEGKGASYTRARRPVALLYYEICQNRSAALIRECAVKALPREKKLELAK
jgi:predicted GIY-YIG superfamily endonuclease